MGAALSLLVSLTSIDCGKCGGVYAISERYRAHAQEHGLTWNCPYCQIPWGFVKSEAAKLREQLAQADAAIAKQRAELERERSRIAMERNSNRVLRGHLTRHKKRAAAGVCPCCQRTFENVARHMKTKHPHYAKEPA